MEGIKNKDYLIRKEEKYEALSRGDKMWVDENKLLLEATIEVITEKINELIKKVMHLTTVNKEKIKVNND